MTVNLTRAPGEVGIGRPGAIAARNESSVHDVVQALVDERVVVAGRKLPDDPDGKPREIAPLQRQVPARELLVGHLALPGAPWPPSPVYQGSSSDHSSSTYPPANTTASAPSDIQSILAAAGGAERHGEDREPLQTVAS